MAATPWKTLLFLTPALAPGAIAPEGRFSIRHPIALLGYAERADCERDGHAWLAEDGICADPGESFVEVDRTGNGALRVKAITTWTNHHACEFMSEKAELRGNLILATQAAEKFDPDTGAASTVPCNVEVRFLDADTVSLRSDRGCGSLCGINAALELDGAKREVTSKPGSIK